MTKFISAFEDFFKSIYELIASIIGTFASVINTIVTSILNLFSGVINLFADVFKGAVDVVGGVGKFLLSKFGTFTYIKENKNKEQLEANPRLSSFFFFSQAMLSLLGS